jgi:hypothetical protein
VSRLMGTSGKSAEFDNVGDTVSGFLIEEPGEAQQTTFGANPEPKFYRNGQPAMMTILRLQTEERVDGEDDGIRILCVADLSKRQEAVAKAIRAAGAADIEVGGWLSLQYTGDGVPQQKGNRPPKLYAAQYQPPPPKQSNLMQAPPVQQQAYQQQQQQYAQQQYQPPVQQQYAPPPLVQQAPQQQAYQPPVQHNPVLEQHAQQQAAAPQGFITVNGQQVPVPPGVDPAAIQAAMANLGLPPQ